MGVGFGLLLGSASRCSLPCGLAVAGPGGVLAGQERGGGGPAGDRGIRRQGSDPLGGGGKMHSGGLGLQGQPIHVRAQVAVATGDVADELTVPGALGCLRVGAACSGLELRPAPGNSARSAPRLGRCPARRRRRAPNRGDPHLGQPRPGPRQRPLRTPRVVAEPRLRPFRGTAAKARERGKDDGRRSLASPREVRVVVGAASRGLSTA